MVAQYAAYETTHYIQPTATLLTPDFIRYLSGIYHVHCASVSCILVSVERQQTHTGDKAMTTPSTAVAILYGEQAARTDATNKTFGHIKHWQAFAAEHNLNADQFLVDGTREELLEDALFCAYADTMAAMGLLNVEGEELPAWQG
jgi:hypothetical protein